jgi:hypothetical protein
MTSLAVEREVRNRRGVIMLAIRLLFDAEWSGRISGCYVVDRRES